MSKVIFVKKANAACSDVWEEVLGKATAYVDKHRSKGVPEEVLNGRGLKMAVVAAIEAEVDALRALGPPEGDEGELDAILTSLEASHDKAAARPPNLSLSEIGKQHRTNKQLRSYGLSKCLQ